MRLIILLTILYLSIPNCLANEAKKIIGAVQKEGFLVVNKIEVVQYFDDYIKHYNDYLSDTKNTSALKAMANSYHLPAFQVIPGVPLRALNSAENLAKGSQNFLDRLITQGVAYIQWEKVDIQMLSNKTAFASNVGVRYKNNGDVFNKAAADYIVLKTNNGWKIAALILHTPEPYNNRQAEQQVNDALILYLKNYNDALVYEGDDISDTIPPLIATGEDMNIPAINISPLGDFVLFSSKQQIIDDTRYFIFDLKSKGATSINYDKIQIKMLSESTVLLSNIASINNKSGTSMFKIGATYIFSKTPKGWKIILRVIHTPETILNLKSEEIS